MLMLSNIHLLLVIQHWVKPVFARICLLLWLIKKMLSQRLVYWILEPA